MDIERERGITTGRAERQAEVHGRERRPFPAQPDRHSRARRLQLRSFAVAVGVRRGCLGRRLDTRGRGSDAGERLPGDRTGARDHSVPEQSRPPLLRRGRDERADRAGRRPRLLRSRSREREDRSGGRRSDRAGGEEGAAAEGDPRRTASRAHLRQLVRQLPRRDDHGPDRRRPPQEGGQDPLHGHEERLRSDRGRQLPAVPRGARRGRPGRGRVHRRQRQERPRHESRRHGHARASRALQPARSPQQGNIDRPSPWLQRREADGLRRGLPDGQLGLPEPSRRAREAANERRGVLVRARFVRSARLRLRCGFLAVPYGNHSGAARARVQSRPHYHGAERGLQRLQDRRHDVARREPGAPPASTVDRPHRRAAREDEHSCPRRVCRCRARSLSGEARRATRASILVERSSHHHVRAPVQRSALRLPRQVEERLARIRFDGLRADGIPGGSLGQGGHPRERRSAGRPLDHRAPGEELRARPVAGGEAEGVRAAAAIRGRDSGGDRREDHRARDRPRAAERRDRQVLRRRHQPQAKAPREAKRGEKADEAGRECGDSPEGLLGDSESGLKGAIAQLAVQGSFTTLLTA